MSTYTVAGHTLVPVGTVAGRPMYTLTSRGDVWRFTPDIQMTYLVRRSRDGMVRHCESLDAAIRYFEFIERQGMER